MNSSLGNGATTDVALEVANAIRANRKLLLEPLKGLLNPSNDHADSHTIQQLETAIVLLENVLATDSPRQAGRYFGAWLKMAIKQSPYKFVDAHFASVTLAGISGAWSDTLGSALSTPGVKMLATLAKSAERLLSAEKGKTVRALFIGDCLLWDASLQLQISALAKGITVEPTILAQRVGADLRNELLKCVPTEFDLVLYSPYTYEFSSEYVFAASPLNPLRAPRLVRHLLDLSIEDVKKTIGLLAGRFECPIYVHIVSGATQSRVGWRGALKHLASIPARTLAARRLNRRLSTHIENMNKMRDRPILRIDERQVCSDIGLRALGLIAYDAGELHPTRLAAELARKSYLRAVRVAAEFETKKLIVCDLDNTLWGGAIGEGAVRQYLDRQQILLSLKVRGLVLAVASKNDPKNVTWRGAALSGSDFVAKMINWSPKSANILAIAEQLNLKPSSFLFLDDRPDEREMASSTIPGLTVLDPNEQETWAMLEHWANTIPHSALQDRTRTYQERTQREMFLNSIAATGDEIVETYRSLDLRLSLRHPEPHEMPRVIELINRTNQFNTTGARTTKQDIASAPEQRKILIADVRDKFGEMGIVGVLVVELTAVWRITHFVLSCRVFGFGIEDAMLNVIKRWNGGTVPIDAPLVETPVNGPCRDVYVRNGFARRDQSWILDGSSQIVDPIWLSLEDKTNPSGVYLTSAAE